MRFLIGIVFAMLVCPVMAEDWQFLASAGEKSNSDYGYFYYDTSSLVRHGRIVNVWSKFDFLNTSVGSTAVARESLEEEIDCDGMTARNKGGMRYFANGTQAPTETYPAKSIETGSLISILAKAVCSTGSKPNLSTSDCATDDLYLTKDGYYGAVNQWTYRDVEDAQKRHNSKLVNDKLKDKSVVKLKGGVRACLIVDATNWYMKQVRIDGFDVPYWVHYDALTKVE